MHRCRILHTGLLFQCQQFPEYFPTGFLRWTQGYFALCTGQTKTLGIKYVCVRAHELHLNHIIVKQRNGVHRLSGPVSNHVQSNCKVVLFLRRELDTSKYNCCIFWTEEANRSFYRVLFPIHVTQRFRHVVFWNRICRSTRTCKSYSETLIFTNRTRVFSPVLWYV